MIKAHSTILLCMVNVVLLEVSEENSVQLLWEKLYMSISLEIRLYLKQYGYAIFNMEGIPIQDLDSVKLFGGHK